MFADLSFWFPRKDLLPKKDQLSMNLKIPMLRKIARKVCKKLRSKKTKLKQKTISRMMKLKKMK